MKEITRNDFNLFQNEILGLIKKSDSKSTEKITELIANLQKTELISDQKFENYKFEVDSIVKNLETNDTIVKLKQKIDELNSQIEEIKSVNENKISQFERDLSNACFKYDKIFLNNISSPGLIGDGCPYPTMKAFLVYANNKIKDFMSSKDKFGIDFKKYHDWVQSSLDKFRDEMNKYKESNEIYLQKEIKQYDKRTLEKTNAVEEKLSFIRVENGKYNFQLNKKWEELEVKLQNFYYINDNLIKIYNKARQEFIKSQNELNNVIQYLNYTKSLSPNGNKTTYDKFNKKIEIKKPQISNYENILPSISTYDELSKLVPNSSSSKNNISNLEFKNNNINNNNNANNKKNMKFTRLFTKKHTLNLDDKTFSFNKLDKINRNMSNIVFTDINGNQNDNLQNNIKSGLSEKQIIQRRSKLILEEKNELNTKQEKSERTKKELKNIQEDETENKEKNDKQTSPLSLKINKNRIFNNSLLAPNKINSFTFERKELRNNNNAEEQKKFNSLQIKYKEDYEEIKFKFEDLFEKTKFKISDLTDHLNQLIIRMNKIIFNKKDNLRMIKDEEYIPERVHKKLFLDNSDKKIFLPLNKSSDEKLSKTVKHKDISKEESKINISSLKHEIKLNQKFIINDKYLIDNFKFNNFKIAELKENDLMNLFGNKNRRQNDYYGTKLKLETVNKIENFLIKKFTDPN
jgi:hypothetical protein